MVFVPPGTGHISHSQRQDCRLHVWFEPPWRSLCPSQKGPIIVLLSSRASLSPSKGPWVQLASTSHSLFGFKVGSSSAPWFYRPPAGSCPRPSPSMGPSGVEEIWWSHTAGAFPAEPPPLLGQCNLGAPQEEFIPTNPVSAWSCWTKSGEPNKMPPTALACCG